MHHRDEELRKAVALFRYGLIADVLGLPPGSRDIRRAPAREGPAHLRHPRHPRTRVAVETMRDWPQALSHRRIRGTVSEDPRRPRPAPAPAPRGRRSARLTEDRAARTVGQGPHRRHTTNAASPTPLAPLPPCTGCSRAEGWLDKRPGEPVATDRRRFALRHAGELWMSDVMHGPKVRDGRRRRKTFLIRLHRRRHPSDSLRRLRVLREHHRVPARAQAGHRAPRAPDETVLRQRGQLPLPAARARVREARHRADSRPPLSARGEGNNRALLPNLSRRGARPPHRPRPPRAWTR